MMPSLATLLNQAWASVTRPREVARWVMSFDLSRHSRWEALLLVAVLSALLAQVAISTVEEPRAAAIVRVLGNPWTMGILQMSFLVIAVFAIYWVGRAMGGAGGFGDAILLVAWLQFCMVCLQLVQTVLFFVLPPFASLLATASFCLFFWLLTNFVAELHGFVSLFQVFLMVIVSIFGLLIGLSLILSVIGITLPGAPMNV